MDFHNLHYRNRGATSRTTDLLALLATLTFIAMMVDGTGRIPLPLLFAPAGVVGTLHLLFFMMKNAVHYGTRLAHADGVADAYIIAVQQQLAKEMIDSEEFYKDGEQTQPKSNSTLNAERLAALLQVERDA